MSPSVDPQVANFNPTAFALGNEQRQANLATTQQEQGLRAQDIALRQQQVQQAQLQNTLAQRQLQDQEIERQMFRDYYGAQASNAIAPASGQPAAGTAPVGNPLSDPQLYGRYMAAHGASAPAIMAGMSSIVQLGTNITKMNSDQIDLETKNLGKLRDDSLGYLGNPSEESYAGLYKDTSLREPRIADELPAPGPGVVPTEKDLQHFLGKVGALGQLIANRKEQAETENLKTTGAKTAAETREIDLKNQLTQEELRHYKTLMSTPQALENYVEENIPRAKYPQLHDAAVSQARQQTDMKGVNGVIEKNAQTAREQERTLAVELDPQVAELRKKQEEDRQNHANALQQGDTATAKYYESAQDVHQTLAAARSIEHIVELARGNPIAGNQLELIVPEFTAAMQGIKPRGMQLNEKGFSSTWDRVMNEVQSAQPGKSSIGASTLNQIMPYIKTIANGAVQNHNATRATINQVYHKNFPEEPTPYQNTANPKPAATGKTTTGMPRVATPADVAKLAKGTHFLDPNGVERISQ